MSSMLARAGEGSEKEQLTGSSAIPSYGSADSEIVYPPTDRARGLTSAEAAKRLQEVGPNELEAAGKDSFLKILFVQMGSVIFLLTTLAAILVYLTATTDEDVFKAKFLICLVAGVCFSNAIGEYSGQDPGAALRAKQKKPECTVVRDGASKLVLVSEIVPGDIVEVVAGDMVPADMRILEQNGLSCNESALTGEPNDARKSVEPKGKQETTFPTNMLYKMTGVSTGSGTGEVTATGMRSQVGLIATNLKGAQTKELCPIQETVNALGFMIMLGCGFLILVGTTSSILMGYVDYPPKCLEADKTCQLLQNVIRGLLMTVTLIPHGMPSVVMVMLRVGSQLMAAQKALVTRQSAVDYLGATNVICTDKTGTLTEGKMAIKLIISYIRGLDSATRFELAPYPLKGLGPQGRIYESRELAKKDRMKQLEEGKSTEDGDLCVPTTDPKDAPAVLARTTAAFCYLGCPDTEVFFNTEDGANHWDVTGNMSEGALKVASWKGYYGPDLPSNGITSQKQSVSPMVRDLVAKHTYRKETSVGFTSARKMSATIHDLDESKSCATFKFGEEHTHFAILKGAPDRVLFIHEDGKDPKPRDMKMVELVADGSKLSVATKPMDPKERENIMKENSILAEETLRALVMAVRPLTATEFEKLEAMKDEDPDERMKLILGPELAFICLFGIYDPPRTSVPPSVSKCHQAGIRVVMITGDQVETARSIGKLVGIIKKGEEESNARTCTALDVGQKAGMGQEDTKNNESCRTAKWEELGSEEKDAITKMTMGTNIWARAQPTDKVTIVKSLVGQELVAAMTGDGVNDAPALKAARIGVSMGISGTQVTQNAADMILQDDNFSTIVAAVEEGRKIYYNLQKYVLFVLSMKASECTCLILAIFLNLPAPLGGVQQLVNMVFTHIIPPTSIAWEDQEDYTMLVKPRKTKGDLVLKGLHVWHRWIPYVICYACIILTGFTLNIWMHTGFVTINALLPVSLYGKGADDNHACQAAGVIDATGTYVIDPQPYHCRCEVSALALGRSDRIVVDQWGQYNAESYRFDKYTGDTGNAFDLLNTPWATESLVKPCIDENGVTQTCWIDPTAAHPVLPSFQCAAYGEKLGQSMTYASIQLGEIASLVTFRTDGPFWFARWSWSYFALAMLNITAYFLVNTVPAFTDKLSMAPLNFHHLCIVLVAPVLLVSASEAIKIGYRLRLRQQLAFEGVKLPAHEDESVKELALGV